MPKSSNKNHIDANTSASGGIPAVTSAKTIDRDMRSLVDLSISRFEAAAHLVDKSSDKLNRAVREARRSISGEMSALVPPGGKLPAKKTAT
jgi:hypothetical protein